ncbi:hypothetical protein CFIICLFH_4511 [Methylobacterium goesingense]|nr:hypothetical protein CFIICLFH_4511 [Methylobacterium goesingense]
MGLHRVGRRPGRPVAVSDRASELARARDRVGHPCRRVGDRVVRSIGHAAVEPAPGERPVAPQGRADEADTVADDGRAALEQVDLRALPVEAQHLGFQGGEELRRRAPVPGRRVVLVVARHQHDRAALGQGHQGRETGFGPALVQVARADQHVEGPARGRNDVEASALQVQVGDREQVHGGSEALPGPDSRARLRSRILLRSRAGPRPRATRPVPPAGCRPPNPR